MLGRQHHEGRAEHRVRPRGEDADRLDVIGLHREGDLGAFAAADPVGLHQPDRLRPVHAAEVQQLVGVVGDAEEPLLQVALDDRACRSASNADRRPQHLLARQHHLVLRAPVDRRHGPIRQPGLVELQEQPLRPAVVARVADDDLASPVEHAAHRPELAAHALDVGVGPDRRMDAPIDGRVLGRQAERVEAHREHHVQALHAAHAAPRCPGRWRRTSARCAGRRTGTGTWSAGSASARGSASSARYRPSASQRSRQRCSNGGVEALAAGAAGLGGGPGRHGSLPSCGPQVKAVGDGEWAAIVQAVAPQQRGQVEPEAVLLLRGLAHPHVRRGKGHADELSAVIGHLVLQLGQLRRRSNATA